MSYAARAFSSASQKHVYLCVYRDTPFSYAAYVVQDIDRCSKYSTQPVAQEVLEYMDVNNDIYTKQFAPWEIIEVAEHYLSIL